MKTLIEYTKYFFSMRNPDSLVSSARKICFVRLAMQSFVGVNIWFYVWLLFLYCEIMLFQCFLELFILHISIIDLNPGKSQDFSLGRKSMKDDVDVFFLVTPNFELNNSMTRWLFHNCCLCRWIMLLRHDMRNNGHWSLKHIAWSNILELIYGVYNSAESN